MLKEVVRKTVLRLFPELAAGLHLPVWAVVITVPDPPAGGETYTEFAPKYAVDVRLLKPNLEIDGDMPLLRDVPVAMSAAAPERGFAALPQPGTIVELAFAFGMQTRPYIRAVLPLGLKLPAIDDRSMRWQQSAASFQEVDAGGSWRRETSGTITDQAAGDILRQSAATITDQAALVKNSIAPKHWIGSEADNFLQIVADFMTTVTGCFNILAQHTHPVSDGTAKEPNQSGDIAGKSAEGTAEKTRLEIIKK